ncbi:Hypothetical_protein [Hexamita inflata]|uniref:Hypothetical_protein n=1 Tax=Hexamita inflata TaxID=28002 RepID=A0AA86VUN8_9EUKA|nr:Hypothetical protein HINF_LOCUS66648 [Hexamita inflata]
MNRRTEQDQTHFIDGTQIYKRIQKGYPHQKINTYFKRINKNIQRSWTHSQANTAVLQQRANEEAKMHYTSLITNALDEGTTRRSKVIETVKLLEEGQVWEQGKKAKHNNTELGGLGVTVEN